MAPNLPLLRLTLKLLDCPFLSDVKREASNDSTASNIRSGQEFASCLFLVNTLFFWKNCILLQISCTSVFLYGDHVPEHYLSDGALDTISKADLLWLRGESYLKLLALCSN